MVAKGWREARGERHRTLKKRPTGKAKVIRKCRQCGKLFEVYQCHIDFNPNIGSFCSISCKAQYQKEHWHKENHPGWKRVQRKCIICGKTFEIKAKQLKLKGGGSYCSKQCLGKARRLSMLWNNPTLREYVRNKLKANWQNPEYRERVIRNTLKGLFTRPTSLEQSLIKFFNSHNLPFAYVGDGSFLIGYKNPDFVNTNGKKVCIEVRNSFFSKPNWAEKRKAHFARYGWDCIIIETNKKYLNDKQLSEVMQRELPKYGIEI